MRSTIALALFSASAVFAAPVAKRADGGSAYTGLGGQAIGGTSTEMSQGHDGLADNAKVINAFSGNAGDGGKAKSGDAFGGQGAIRWVVKISRRGVELTSATLGSTVIGSLAVKAVTPTPVSVV